MVLSRRLAPLGLVAALALLVACFSIVMIGRSDGAQSALPGASARNFRLPDLDSNLISLKDLRGRVVVMYFAGEGSEPLYDPMLLELARSFQDESRVAMLAVFPETSDRNGGPADSLRLHAERSEAPLATLIDPTQDVLRQYKVGRSSTWFVIDQRGVIRFRAGVEAGNWSQSQLLDECRNTIQTLLTSAQSQLPVS